jgi:hypothetical protein
MRWIAAIILLLLVVYALRRARPPPPHPRYADAVAAATPHAPEDAARADAMLRAFAAAYQKTFSSCDKSVLDTLNLTRQKALTSLHASTLRLPQDAAARSRARDLIDRVTASTLAHIEDACDRCRAGLALNAPLQDFYYSRWYRAANDVHG